ncbi:MAG: PAS domain S-box protein [Chloroflexi bacterium]|nr:MAG: PAS domain S-box protein [Chloroflexota bacterium]
MNGEKNGKPPAWWAKLKTTGRRFGSVLILDVVLVVAGVLLFLTSAQVLYFHVIFIALTFGAFFWQFPAFVGHALVWVTVATVGVLLPVMSGQIPAAELIEIPLLTAILILVFGIAQQRSQAEEQLRKANEELEERVISRTAELTREINHRRQTELTLRESEERYRRLVELSFEAVVIHRAGTVLNVNQACVRLLGATDARQLIGKNLLAFIHPDFRDVVQERISRLDRHEDGVPLLEEKFVRLDGTTVDVEVAAVPIVYDGQTAVQAVLRDITARKQAEAERERLLATEREQRMLAETLGGIFLSLAAQTSLETVLDEILYQSRRIVSYRAANIVLLEDHTLRVVRHTGYEHFSPALEMDHLLQPLQNFPLDSAVVKSRLPLVIRDTRRNPYWVSLPDTAWIRSSMFVPICLRDQVLGLLRFDSDQPNSFSQTDLDRVMPLANAAAISLENTRLYEQLRQELEERIRVEENLRQVAAKNQALLDAIPDSLLFVDRQGRLIDYKIHGQLGPENGSAPVGPAAITEIFQSDPDLTGMFLSSINRAIASGHIQTFEYQLPDTRRFFEVRIVGSGPDEALVIISEVSERKAREEALQAERMRLARDLHDSLGQNLGYLRLKLDEFSSEGVELASDYCRRSLRQMRDVANEAYELVRNMIAAARPDNATNLSTALMAQARAIASRARFQVHLKTIGKPRPLTPVVQQQVLFICREALNNIARHASAANVELNLAWSSELLAVTIRDDGVGFSPQSLDQAEGHYGLQIMEERASEIDAIFTLASAEGSGTEITLYLPLTAATLATHSHSFAV